MHMAIQICSFLYLPPLLSLPGFGVLFCLKEIILSSFAANIREITTFAKFNEKNSKGEKIPIIKLVFVDSLGYCPQAREKSKRRGYCIKVDLPVR